MNLDKIIVMISGGIGIAFTYWFFLIKKEKTVNVKDSVEIVVEGGYSPEVVSISKNKKTKLNFTRRDSNSCLEEIVISDFGIRRYLPLNEKVSIEITPKKTGEFTYSCGMNMFHGKIIVAE